MSCPERKDTCEWGIYPALFGSAIVIIHKKEKERLFSTMQQRLEKAREEDKKAIADMEAAYDEALLDADRQARSLYEAGAARREKDYKLLVCWK